MPSNRLVVAAVLAAIAPSVCLAEESGESSRIDFNRDVRPILSEKCFACHGFDKNKREAGLRLDTKAGLFSPPKPDAAIPVIAGKPDESELIDRVTSDQDDQRMPPPKKGGKTLTPKQVETLRRWVAEGAEWKGHWAYIPPVKHAVPKVEGVHQNPVDAFILARIKDAGLSPSPEADRATLIRRLSFDLIGLPPTSEEVRAFLDDERPDSYERLVDRLLASPHYGEAMAARWLDLVRFADTIGYHSDNNRNVWPYRDYVIDSFNRNVSFEAFTIEQLAGDLLPGAGVREKVASGYNHLLQTTEEGGAQAKEYAAKYAADRVRNASTVWLGQTMGCAECHDHKFDPILTRDFYRFAAFFADINEPIVGKRDPGMPVYDEAGRAQLDRLGAEIIRAKARLAANSSERASLQSAWVANHREPIGWAVIDPDAFHVEGESSLRKEAGGILKTYGKVAATETLVVSARLESSGVTGFKLEAIPDPDLPGNGPGTASDGSFLLTEFKLSVAPEAPDAKPADVPLISAIADSASDGSEAGKAIDGDDRSGWSSGAGSGRPSSTVFETIAPLTEPGSGPIRVTFRLGFRSSSPQKNIGRFRISATTAPDPASRWVPDRVRSAMENMPQTPDDAAAIASFFRAQSPAFAPDRAEIGKAVQASMDFLETLPKSMIAVSGMPRTTRILPRGNWMSDEGDVVEPGMPAFLPQPDVSDRRLNRLDLARWIVSRDNPLPARVFMNRLWKMAFGQGLSKVLDDLGAQGEWPTHPELLDWLAAEFMDSGWDVKHMTRLSSPRRPIASRGRATPEAVEHDPYNRLLARQARYRIDAEAVRDGALRVSGLLVEKVGGPSVKPFQPPGYWDSLNFPTRTWEADSGESQHRRALYTFWQRTFPQPSLLAFDAPSREECTAERPRSNIPQQALALLNDPSYVEASRALAVRMIREGGSDRLGRVAWAFEAALSRRPTADEAKVLIDLYDKHLAEYRADEGSAKTLLKVGQVPAPADITPSELAAWTSVARTILNLHEAITRP